MANLLYMQEFGPKISQFQNLDQYKKVISEISQTSEQRELQQKENFLKSKAKESNILQQIVKRKIKNESKQQDRLLTFIQRTSLVNKFVSNLFQNSYILPKKFKYLQVDDYIPQSQKFQNIKNPSENTLKFRILKPDNKYLLYWDVYGLIINMISLWLSPFQTSFDFTSPKSLLYLIIVYLLLDILVNFNRSTIAKGEIINNRSFITKNYFKGNASFDFINLFIWLKLLIYDEQKILQEILQFIQLIIIIKKLLTSYNNFFESLYSKATNTGLTDLGFLIIAVYFFAHIMACLWFYVGKKSESFYQISWLQKFNIENQSTLIQYNYSIYWAITTIVTVGYGDIIPQNSIEILFATIMMVISSLVYAYLLNQIGNILKNYYERKQQYKKMLFKLDYFLNKNDVDKGLQLRAKNFLKYHVSNKEQKENSDEFKNILLLLPERLKNSIEVDVKQKQTEKISFLKEIFTKNTIQEISKILEIIYLSPEEILYQQSEYSDSSLYYVYDGQIILYEKKSQKLLSTVNAGQKFGEYQFFTGLFPKYSAKSPTNTIIYKISREKLLQIIQQNEVDFQKFNDIKDDILLNSNYQKCHTFCKNCQQQNHQTIDCPILLYKPNLEQRLKKSRFNEIQNFRSFHPRKNCKFSSLINQSTINSSIKCFLRINKRTYLANVQKQRFVEQHGNLNLENSYEASEDNYEEQIKSSLYQFQFSQFESKKQSIIQQSMIQEQVNIRPSKVYFDQQSNKQLNTHKHISLIQTEQQTLLQIKANRRVELDKQQLQFDQVKEFKEYMPQNNFSFVLKLYQKTINQKKNLNSELNISKYSFFYYVKNMVLKMKKKDKFATNFLLIN